MKKYWKIAVLKGGPSTEREVSLRSGQAVAVALRQLGHLVTEVDVEGMEFFLPSECDVAFIALHGTFGEDGQVQEILEARGVPYTGCGIESSRKAFDKAWSKKIFQAAKVPSPAYEICQKGQRPSMKPPFVVKPSRQGSSVGITRVMEEGTINAALERAFEHDETLVIEQLVSGKELTVGILNDQVLPVVHIEPKEGFYDYKNKYTPGRTEYHCPAVLSDKVTQQVQQAALAAHRALGCEVYSRVDVLLDAQSQPWVLEANTIPGMTETSLLPKAAATAGISFGELCERIIELSLKVNRQVKDS